jgi:alkyl hydroperoxide reductase subunit AhpC
MDGRCAFVVDKDGVIRHTIVCAPGTIPESKELLEKLKAL